MPVEDGKSTVHAKQSPLVVSANHMSHHHLELRRVLLDAGRWLRSDKSAGKDPEGIADLDGIAPAGAHCDVRLWPAAQTDACYSIAIGVTSRLALLLSPIVT